MVTYKSKKREIADLQRLLLSLDLLDPGERSTDGVWGEATQGGVNRLYELLGWNHPDDGRWVTASALAAIAGSIHRRSGNQEESAPGTTGGGGSHTGGGGSHTGGGGSHTGGGSSPPE